MGASTTPRETKEKNRLAAMEAATTFLSPILEEIVQRKIPNLKEFCEATAAKLLEEGLKDLPPQRIEIRLNEEVLATIPRQHYLFETALRMLEARDAFGSPLNIALVGPPGTGKTRMGMNAAEALKEEFMLQPFNPQTTKSELVGYMDATGKYVESPFYKAFKQGKLFIADEFDAANPAVATVLNAAVSNRVMTFPNGETVKAHKDFRTMFAMNTYGTGGDDRFTGRGRLDLATLDRMVFLYVPIDPGLEASLVGIKNEKSPRVDVTEGGRFRNEREILHQIVSVRGAVEREKLRYSISPRATIHACALHNAGFGKKIIMESCVWRGIPESERSKIQRSMAA